MISNQEDPLKFDVVAEGTHKVVYTKPQLSFAVVVWRDSHGIGGGWVDREEAASRGLGVIFSSGWVIHKDADSIVLAPHLATQVDDVGGDITIPLSCVLQQWEVDLP